MFQLILILIATSIAIAGTLAYRQVLKMRNQYKSFKDINPMPAHFVGLTRNDFHKWNYHSILFGCYFILPFKFAALASVLFGCCVFAMFIKIFGQRTILCKMLAIYLNTYAKLMTRVACRVEEQFDISQPIRTPIVISNHVSWFDIFYISMGFAPLSFVSKSEIQQTPIIGVLSKTLQCIYVDRKNQSGRTKSKQDIKTRIAEISAKKKNKYPLAIFPEGTTSNGKALLTFKNGAFQNLSPITAFCLTYSCDHWDPAMDQISQLQHVILMMAQHCKLVVRKVVFEPMEGENGDQYQSRCRSKMAQILGIELSEGGFRDKLQLAEYRQKCSKNI